MIINSSSCRLTTCPPPPEYCHIFGKSMVEILTLRDSTPSNLWKDFFFFFSFFGPVHDHWMIFTGGTRQTKLPTETYSIIRMINIDWGIIILTFHLKTNSQQCGDHSQSRSQPSSTLGYRCQSFMMGRYLDRMDKNHLAKQCGAWNVR